MFDMALPKLKISFPEVDVFDVVLNPKLIRAIIFSLHNLATRIGTQSLNMTSETGLCGRFYCQIL